ncbi:MAG: hypothetical protein MUC51_05345 [Anaerolineae bacterium]|jgi:hypothetical protein|nr:hypothetical protein [Anaerolineae bacterium]
MLLPVGRGAQLSADGVTLGARSADGCAVEEDAVSVGVDAAGARDAGGAGVPGRLDCVCGGGADGGVTTDGRGAQAVSKKRTAIASQFCKPLALGAI